MTKPSSTPIDERRMARDVAKQIDRRRGRRRMTLWALLLAAVAAGASYLRCGTGFGLGGGGGGSGDEEVQAPQRVAGESRCAIRLSAAGLTINGKAISRDAAVTACKAAVGADILVTGDARHGDATELVDALKAGGVKDVRLISAIREPAAGSGSAAR